MEHQPEFDGMVLARCIVTKNALGLWPCRPPVILFCTFGLEIFRNLKAECAKGVYCFQPSFFSWLRSFSMAESLNCPMYPWVKFILLAVSRSEMFS